MKAVKHGTKYQITYRCPNYPKLINETFGTEEEANLRIAQINLEKKLGTLLPPAYLVDPERDRDLYRETVTVAQLMTDYPPASVSTIWNSRGGTTSSLRSLPANPLRVRHCWS